MMTKNFCDHQFFLLKNIFKISLQCLFNAVILIKLKIDPKTCTFKNHEEISQKQVATL